MSIDQNLNAPAPQPSALSAIENELPAYRAINPQAVFAVLFGVLAVLSFASWFFLSFAALAVLLGVLADRKIQRLPDVLTGRGLAQAGIGLGLVFGLTSVTIGTVQSVLRSTEAGKFARVYEGVLKTGTFEQAVWYGQPPATREKVTPEALVAQMKSQGPGPSFEMHSASLRDLKAKLATPGADLHFKGLEAHGLDGMTVYATALYEVDVPEAKNPAEREQFALALVKASTEKGKTGWWVDDVRFPYKPKSYVVSEKPVDDGHGHGH